MGKENQFSADTGPEAARSSRETGILARPPAIKAPEIFAAATIRQICLAAGATDAGFVDISREALDAERADILRVYPRTRSLITIILAMNR